MLRNFKVVTLTHKNARLNELSSFMLQHDTDESLRSQLSDLKEALDINELLYLSTCNRVMYFMDRPAIVNQDFLQTLSQTINPGLNTTDTASLLERVQIHEGSDAIIHLFEVAASIDSMVVGEREILRQLREAYDRCLGWGLTGDNIRLAMQAAVNAAKEVYAKTRIGEKPISIVSLAIQQLLKSGLPKTARILLIGAGQTNMLVAKFLKKHEFQNVHVFNRSADKAKKLTAIIGSGSSATLDDLYHYQEGFDCIITCTGHTQSWIDDGLYQTLRQNEEGNKLVIDLAVPNNFCEGLRHQAGLHYIEVETLRQIARENIAFREQEVDHARHMLDQKIIEFNDLVQLRSIELAMREVPTEIKAVKAHAINQVFKKELEHLPSESLELIGRMMDYMEKRCISIPMQAAKRMVE